MIKGNHAMNSTAEKMIEEANKMLDAGERYLLVEGVKENGTLYAAWITSPELKSCLTGSVTLKAMQANTEVSPEQK